MKIILFVMLLCLGIIATGQKNTTFQALQGKWQSADDRTNCLWFDNNHRKEIAEGMKAWDDELFVLANACKNPADKSGEMPKELNRYISVLSSDMCWYIETLTPTRLVLSYVGRGNVLTYKKVLPQKSKKKK